MGFKDFCENNEQINQNQNINDMDDLKKTEKKVEDMYNKYKGKSEDELISELYKNIEKQKKDGTFNYENIENMAKKLSPFLNQNQRKKMQELLENIK